MAGEETSKRKDTTKSAGLGFGPMGQGMFEMMKTCCGGEGGFADCAAKMKEKMGAMANGCCGADGGKK